ncbi:hypothetical protein CBR_g30886 [Chara braunii]|uniref:Reverse transcriptase domain-containing protein n=1 Tax=Chara braunii TaxID=69332 RepID=A0A388LDN8_CHABU|nr:hypothetical protein CBR_g30886 [Chara braunii]|eukprot:GBG80421.1 hypothetical protein CBR_g30886 [Chara braunii]
MREEELSVLRAQLDDLLEKGWIRPSSSPYGAHVIFVRKKNKDLRLCIDYRKLNAQTVKKAGPLSRIVDLLEWLGGDKFFSKLDVKSGYHQLEILQEDRYKTAFKTRYGHFEWLVMPFGLTNAPATFQAAMTTEFRHMLDRLVLIHLDDILVYSRSLNERVEHLCTELEYLGHYVTPQGIRPLADKFEAIRVWLEPTNTTDVRSFMGLAGYYQRFITGYSRIAAPMTRLQSPKMPFVFDDDAHRSFQALKTVMLMAPVLSIYDPTMPSRVTTDTSGYGIGTILEQHDGDDWHPVEYFSHKVPPINSLDDARKELLAFVMALKRWRHFLLGRRRFTWVTDNNPLTYYKTRDTEGKKSRLVQYMSKKMPSKKLAKSTYERELYALCKALVHWRHYLLGRFFYLRTDHQILKWIKTRPVLSDAVKRWIQVTDQYDFKLDYVKGEYNKLANALSRRADYEFGLSDDLTRSLGEAYKEDPITMDIINKLQAKDKATTDEFVMVDGLLFLEKAGFKSWWTPATGGANVPALNDLLKPYGIAFGDTVLNGREEQYELSRSQDMVVRSMRMGFRDFARELVGAVGAEVNHRLEKAERFCVGAIEGVKATTPKEEEARPRREPVKVKFPDSYNQHVLIAIHALRDEAASFARSLVRSANCNDDAVAYSSFTPLVDFMKLLRERFADVARSVKASDRLHTIHSRQWKSVRALKGVMDEWVAVPDHGVTETQLVNLFYRAMPESLRGHFFAKSQDPSMTYDALSREVVAFEAKSVSVSTFWHKDLDKGKKWKGRTISGQVKTKDSLVLTLDEGSVNEIPYDQIEWGLEDEDSGVSQGRTYVAVAAGGGPQGGGRGQGQGGRASGGRFQGDQGVGGRGGNRRVGGRGQGPPQNRPGNRSRYRRGGWHPGLPQDNRTMVVEDYVEGVQTYFRLEKDGKVEKVLHSLTLLVEDSLIVLGMDWVEAAGATLHIKEHECRLPSPSGEAKIARLFHVSGVENPLAHCCLSAPAFAKLVKKEQLEEQVFVAYVRPVTERKEEKPIDPAIAKLLEEFKDLAEPPIGVVPRPIQHRIEIEPGSRTPKGAVYRMSPRELEELHKQLDELLEKGWIRPSSSPFGAHVLFVPKKEGDLRMCIDYRGLNAITVKNVERSGLWDRFGGGGRIMREGGVVCTVEVGVVCTVEEGVVCAVVTTVMEEMVPSSMVMRSHMDDMLAFMSSREAVTEVRMVLSAWRMAERSRVAVFAGGCSAARLWAMLSTESVRMSDMLMEDVATSGQEGVEDVA